MNNVKHKHAQTEGQVEDIDKYAPFAFICDHACMHTAHSFTFSDMVYTEN